MTTPFKTQQEIFAHLANGGKVIGTGGSIVFFDENGKLNDSYKFDYPSDWKPYIEPKPEIKVYRFEKWSDDILMQTEQLYTKEYAAEQFPEWTIVPGSERVKESA